jgi:hypothetical protein
MCIIVSYVCETFMNLLCIFVDLILWIQPAVEAQIFLPLILRDY